MALEIHVACMDPKCKKCNPRWSPGAGRFAPQTKLERKQLLVKKFKRKVAEEQRRKLAKREEHTGVPYESAMRLLKFCKSNVRRDNINAQYRDQLKQTISALQGIKVYW